MISVEEQQGELCSSSTSQEAFLKQSKHLAAKAAVCLWAFQWDTDQIVPVSPACLHAANF